VSKNATLVAPHRPLAVHHFPAAASASPYESFVLLHGWGCDSQSWQPLLDQLQQLGDVSAIDLPGFGDSPDASSWTLEDVLELLAALIPPQATLVGWSLGGMLATALAARYPEKVKRLVTLAANVKFVATDDYPTALPPAVNAQFSAGFSADPQGTLKLFSGLLAQGDAQERALLKRLRAATRPAPAPTTVGWRAALDLLSQLDLRATFAGLSQPGLHIFGAADALVPAAAAAAVQQLNPQQRVVVVPAAAHAVHWSQPEQVTQLIHQFMDAPNPQVATRDKRTIARSFSRAAASYDAVAGLQRSVGEALVRQLAQKGSPSRVLDLGCGTGYFCSQLAQRFPAAQLVGLDLAEAMVRFARERTRAAAVNGDAEQLPLQTSVVDVVFSSLVIQWCDDLPRLFAELQRVLKPGGRLAFSTLGPATLHELKAAWRAVDNDVHVNEFQPAQVVERALWLAGFQIEQWQVEQRVLHFSRVGELTRELKSLGAHNMNPGRAEGLTGRQKITRLKNAYEAFRTLDGLPATYEVIYSVAVR
jgi:malonyl-CoA O-methyltransferase